MFSGYLHFAGTELANSARTAAYAKNFLSGLHFDDAWEGEDLPCVLNEGSYQSPVTDPAPWFSEYRPASAKFYGFYPLAIQGVEDSSRSVKVTELVQDGAVMSLPRRASKEFRVRGLMVGADQQGMDSGMQWLRGALEGANCSDGADCVGESFCYFAYLPSCCDYSDTDLFPDMPVDYEWSAGQNGEWSSYAKGSIASSTNGIYVQMPCDGDGLQYFAKGLIPGQEYRLTLDMSSSALLTVAIAGRTIVTAHRSATAAGRIRSPWVIDFTATSQTESVRITSAEGDCTAETLRLYGMRVEREPMRKVLFLPRFSWQDYAEPSSWVWVNYGDVPAQRVLTSQEGWVEALRFLMTNTTGSTITVDALSGPQRLIRGLVPGEEYIAYVKATADGGFDLSPEIEGIPGVRTSLGQNWHTFKFTAEASTHDLRLATASDFNIPGDSSVTVELEYLRVDVVTTGMGMPTPDQGANALRSLHGVTLLNGPNMIHEYRSGAGYIQEVEFSMAAARPNIYSELKAVFLDPAATSGLVATGRCANGEPVRTNLFTNPFLRSSISGGLGTFAAPIGTAATLAASTTPGDVGEGTGQWLQITPTGADEDCFAKYMVDNSDLQVGHTYTISASFFQDGPMAGIQWPNARRIYMSNAAGWFDSEQAIDTSGKQRVSVSFVHTGSVWNLVFYNGSDDPADIVYWSEFLIEEGGTAGTVFDGASSADTSWDGIANQSPSLYEKRDAIVIQDPDCPPIPLAPQPPGIDPACARDVDEWRRYWINVPPELAGGWSQSVPVIELTTETQTIRDVRIRFYQNPSGARVSELADCEHCGEFYISYIPPRTTMTIDGINQQAMADVQDSGSSSVMHLISDADYGPIHWPSMSCDIPYMVTIDIAPDEVQKVAIQLSVAMKE